MRSRKDQQDRSRLTPEERGGIIEIVTKLAEGREIIAICAYGSKVAGYGKPESDYDVILVLSEYPPKVRYRYVSEGLNVSALLVDKDSLISDAEEGKLGEFVVGRLLNVYEPLMGEEYLKGVEYRYKKRVIIETIYEIVSTYGDFSYSLRIPIEYFLFEKLKKRAAIYPPALYSYVKTYGGAWAKENLKATLTGFQEALKSVEEDGLISVKGDEVSIRSGAVRHQAFGRFKLMMKHTTRGLKQYAVHGYAGRVGWDVIGKEIASKLWRSKEVGEVPDEIKRPKNLWRVEEGLLLIEGEEWQDRLAQHLGLGKDLKLTHKRLGELYNITYLYTLEGKDKRVRVVVKKFGDIKSYKWALLNFWALPARRFRTSPLARLSNEYSLIRSFRYLGLNTPEVLAIILHDKVLITRFIEGIEVGKIISEILQDRSNDYSVIQMLGEEFGKVHKQGYSLGDTKPSNYIYDGAKIYLTDLEQAGMGGDQAWDIAEFLYYSAKLTLDSEKVRKITNAFLNGYLRRASIDAVKKSLNVRYIAPFQPILSPHVVKVLREEVEDVVKGQLKGALSS
ncbi:MAG: hypothetical protein QW815_03460 [Nitrososphaerota archaeon]